jgi:hypothetical protein
MRQHSSFNEITGRNAGTADCGLVHNGRSPSPANQSAIRNRKFAIRTLVATYSYDALGRRIRKEVSHSGALNGTTDGSTPLTTSFYLDGWREVEERDESDAPVGDRSRLINRVHPEEMRMHSWDC